ncbi:MAG: RecX family transcriptional regulator [Chloroflexi bacterium]|nr:RecX family transcriptional regulator [Chloroflexota bacterium]MCY4247138.1 RecX family transcriptional regulator [Chloroflexota bacterium]
MPVITALKTHRRNKERVKLYLDDEYAFQLPLLEAAGLSCGQELRQQEIAALLEAGALQNAYDRAVRFLARRPRSAEEVRRYLLSKEVGVSVIAVVLERLQARAWLDDVEFARYWVDQRQRHKPMGARALRYQLRQKGVAEAVIEAALECLDETDAAYRVAQSRLARYRGQTPRAFRQKLGGLLMRRGFAAETVRQTTMRCQQEIDEEDSEYFHREADA